MKLTTGILAITMLAGAAGAQNPSVIDSTRSTAQSLQQSKTNQIDAALNNQAQATKPTPGAAAPAVKPAVIPGAKAAAAPKLTTVAAKPSSSSAPAASAPAKAAVKPASSENNRLEHVKVIRNADDVQIEISSREAVTPKVSKLSSPARVVVELPATAMATAQNKIPVGSAGVKGVRIGMDGKTPPNTSVVVDLEQALSYELTPGPGNTFVLTLHTAETSAKSSAAPTKSSVPAAKAQVAAKNAAAPAPARTAAPANTSPTAVAKPVFAPPSAAAKVAMATAAPKAPAAKGVTAAAAPGDKVAAKPAGAASSKITASPAPATTKIAAAQAPKEEIKKVEAPKPPKPEEKKWAMTGKRDPFFSPVVQQTSGSGCSTGKKCLEIGQINVRGVVRSENGFIAVVTNSLNKAYFLHENDPVFNGYVVKITGDSVVFQETMQDKLGKPFTREVVKRILTPAV